MAQLALIIVAPIFGVLLYIWLRTNKRFIRLIDKSMYIIIPALLIWTVIPHAWEAHQWRALLVFAAGAAFPVVFESLFSGARRQTEKVALLTGIAGLFFHAFLEGGAIVPDSINITAAATAHRIPVGLLIWYLLAPRYGNRIASLGIGGLIAVTIAGFVLATMFFETGHVEHAGHVDHGHEEHVHSDQALFFQVFVGGTLLHVIFHKPRTYDESDAHDGHLH